MKNSLKYLTALTVGIGLVGSMLSCSTASKDQANLSHKDRQKIAKEAYIYGYPLVLMDMSRRVSTNVSKADAEHAPMNQFSHRDKFPDSSFREVVSPNVDTLYSIAWLDLGKGPMILSVPNTKDRYYMLPMFDAYTNVFFSPGTRTTGNGKKDFVIVGPNHKGDVPGDLEKVQAPTDLVWILGRTKTNGVSDYKAVNSLQKQYTLTPLSEWRRVVASFGSNKVDPFIDTTTAPAKQVADLDGVEFFRRMSELMKTNPPADADAQVVADMKKIGLLPGETLRTGPLDDEMKADLIIGAKDGFREIARTTKDMPGKKMNGWTYTDNIGTYKTDYLKRAAVAMGGLGANLDADAIYPHAYVDIGGDKLTGTRNYIIRFNKDQKPPVKGFWSLTVYDKDHFLVKNPINRYALGDRDRLKYNADGSFDIYLQSTTPGKERQANWLPTPAGEFIVVMRMYWPDLNKINAGWVMPGIQKATSNSNLAGIPGWEE